MSVFNQDADIALLFKTVFGIYDGPSHTGNLFNFDELQEVEVTTLQDTEKYYSATGKKRKKATGDSSEYRLLVKSDASLIDTANPPTDIKTISYFQDQIHNERKTVEASFEGLKESEAVSNKFLRHQFTATVESIIDRRNPETGALEMEISGEILTHVKHHRQAS